jgi:hypothetical protein
LAQDEEGGLALAAHGVHAAAHQHGLARAIGRQLRQARPHAARDGLRLHQRRVAVLRRQRVILDHHRLLAGARRQALRLDGCAVLRRVGGPPRRAQG